MDFVYIFGGYFVLQVVNCEEKLVGVHFERVVDEITKFVFLLHLKDQVSINLKIINFLSSFNFQYNFPSIMQKQLTQELSKLRDENAR